MDFNQIMMIAKMGSISKAAEVLYLSQPTLSHALLKAEQQFGVKLFDRSPHPLKLTFAGEKYIEMVQGIMYLRRNFEKICSDINENQAGMIRIGAPYQRASQTVAPAMKNFAGHYPNMEVKFYASMASHLFSMLDCGELDLCILPKLENDPRFVYHPILFEELILVSPPGVIRQCHKGGKENSIKMNALMDLPLIMPDTESGLGKYLNIIFQTFQIAVNRRMTLPYNQLILSMVSQGMGVAVLPQDVLDHTVLDLPVEQYSITDKGIGWEISAIVKKGAVYGQCEAYLVDLIRDNFKMNQKQELDVYPKFP